MKQDILFLSHCAPTLPDKGERIRAYHEVQYLAKRYRVHVAALSRDARSAEEIERVKSICASLHIERLDWKGLPGQGIRYLCGNSLTGSFYYRSSLLDYVRALCKEIRPAATVAFTSVMAAYAPERVPLLLDMVDVDSEKWLEYARMRSPHWFYRMEGRRLQKEERHLTGVAKSVILTSGQERDLLLRIAPQGRVRVVANGVDFSYFDPSGGPTLPTLAGRRYIAMVGAMGYYPNAEGAIRFARDVFPVLREKTPGLEFIIVGHKPPANVQNLGTLPGITVTGYVPDVRPYVTQSLAAVVPLRIARGVQNKVLEALALGKTVLASAEIGRTFGESLPLGLRICRTAEDYHQGIQEALSANHAFDPAIRDFAVAHFSWDQVFQELDEELKSVLQALC